MMPHFRKLSKPTISLVLAFFLLGCSNTPPRTVIPSLTFTHLPITVLNISRIEVVDNYQPPQTAPNVEHLFPTPLYKAVNQYAQNRFQTGNPSGVLRIIINDAHVVAKDLPVQEGFKGLFYRDPSQEYQGRIALALKFYADDAALNLTGEARVLTERTMTTIEGISLAKKEQRWLEMTEGMINDLDKATLRVLQNELGHLIVMSSTPPETRQE